MDLFASRDDKNATNQNWGLNAKWCKEIRERAEGECVCMCVLQTMYKFPFLWMRGGCHVIVSNAVKKQTHISESLIEECLTGSSNSSRLILGNVWKNDEKQTKWLFRLSDF